jgi:serine/threonine-protein kinase
MNVVPSGENTLQQYRLLSLLARGGMGEVYLARHEGPAGFAKTVVIKQILKSLAAEDQFVEMFLNEARLAALLSHPNIVQIFELGHSDETYYIAMEYIHGKSLRAIKKRLRELSMNLPPPVAALIAAQVLRALHYAHTLANEEGELLNIIHRDVSPENVLVGYSGVVKLVDFGIAKASSASDTTRSGMLKGKFAYMAPEQFASKVTPKADVYAVGVVLYEMLSGSPPFKGESDGALVRAILQDPVTPLKELGFDVPAVLDAIIMNALTKDPEQRYENAEAMAVALEEYVHSTGQKISNQSVSALVKELFGNEATQPSINTGLTPIRRTNTNPSNPGLAIEPTAASGPHKSPVRSSGSKPLTRPGVSQPPALPTPSRPPVPEEEVDLESKVQTKGSNKIVPIAAAAGVLLLLGGAGIFALTRPSEKPVKVDPVAVADPPAHPAATTPKPTEAANPPTPPTPVTPPPAEVAPPSEHHDAAAERVVEKGGSKSHKAAPVKPAAHASKATPAPTKQAPALPPIPEAAAAPEPGTLSLRVNPYAEVFVDGRSYGQTPIEPVTLSPGHHTVTLKNPQLGADRKQDVVIKPHEQTAVRIDLLE